MANLNHHFATPKAAAISHHGKLIHHRYVVAVNKKCHRFPPWHCHGRFFITLGWIMGCFSHHYQNAFYMTIPAYCCICPGISFAVGVVRYFLSSICKEH